MGSMIKVEYLEKNMDAQEFAGTGCPITGKVYRHSENLKNDLSFLMATDEVTIEDLMKIFFEGERESGTQAQLPLELSSRD
jgi:hypothetical protein